MTFQKQVDAWIKKAEKNKLAVFRRSAEMIGEEMVKTKAQGGRLPFLTGNLARSLLASTKEMPKTSDEQFKGSNLGAVTARAKLTDAIYMGFQARYARRMEYGFIGQDSLGRTYDQKGHHFVQGAIDKWPQIVRSAAKEVSGL